MIAHAPFSMAACGSRDARSPPSNWSPRKRSTVPSSSRISTSAKFLSRLFRHSGIYIRTDRSINRPQDLKGKTIGLPEYQITANVWIRGILQDEYGIKPSDIKWRRGGLEDAGRDERAPIKLPPDIDLADIPTDRTLSHMLASGELDGLVSARAPSCYLNGAPNVDRLFPN